MMTEVKPQIVALKELIEVLEPLKSESEFYWILKGVLCDIEGIEFIIPEGFNKERILKCKGYYDRLDWTGDTEVFQAASKTLMKELEAEIQAKKLKGQK